MSWGRLREQSRALKMNQLETAAGHRVATGQPGFERLGRRGVVVAGIRTCATVRDRE